MRLFFACLTALLAVAACEEAMPIPSNHIMIDASSYGGSVPVASIECPKDQAPVMGADIRNPVAALLANDEYIQLARYRWSYNIETPAFSFITFSTTDYEAPMSGGMVDVLNAQIGDIIFARFSATLQNENAGPSGNGNRLRLAAIDDLGGGGETAPAQLEGARLYLSTPTGQMIPAMIEGEWEVTVAGTTRIQVEGRTNAGAGEQLIIQSSAYLIAIHTRSP